jgi:tetratricopeptide (TPR) repeat protein
MHLQRAVLLSVITCASLAWAFGLSAQEPLTEAAPEALDDAPDEETTLLEVPVIDPPAPLYSPWSWSYGTLRYGLYPYGSRLARRDLEWSFRTGRAVERYRQNVFELRRKLQQRLQHTYRGEADESLLDLNPPPWYALYDERRYRPSYRGWPYGRGYALGELYDRGREVEYYRQQEGYLREQLTLLSYRDLFDRGLDMFRAGSYGHAARAFIAAADKNHEDAASRIHAAQCLMAVGMYEDAVAHVRRAFELQPLLMQLPMNLASDYRNKEDYADHIATLKAHVEAHPKDDQAAILLAYELFFSERPQDAAEAMKRIKPLAPRDPLAAKLLTAAAPIVPGAR